MISENLCICKLFIDDRDIYNIYNKYIYNISNIDYITKKILFIIDNYYKEYINISSINIEDIIIYINTKYNLIKEKDTIIDTINKIYSIESNKELIIEYINNISNKYFVSSIIEKLVPILDSGDKATLVAAEKEISEYISVANITTSGDNVTDDPALCNYTLEDLVKEENENPGYNWNLSFLTENLGTLRGDGQLIHIFATPNVGKTSFCTALTAALAYQMNDTDDHVLYFNNEGRDKVIWYRIMQALCNKDKEYLSTHYVEAQEYAKASGLSNIKLFGPSNTVSFIEKRIEKYTPKIVLIDQGVKVSFRGQSEKQVERLQQLYNKYRVMASEYNIDIITVGQASDSARKKRWLTQDDAANSKIDLPGECDIMLGISRDNSPVDNFTRYISICKDKIGAPETTFQCMFDRGTGRYLEN